MAKERVITTFGPFLLGTLTGTTGTTETPTTWKHMGPILANRLYVGAKFISASGAIKTSVGNRIKVRGVFADDYADLSTAMGTVLVSRLSSQQTLNGTSTVAAMFKWFRIESTALVNAITAKVWLSAIP